MPFSKPHPSKNRIEVEIDRLVTYGYYPLKGFKGRRLEQMVDSIRSTGIVNPITVRPAQKGKYQILDGHYRVAAASTFLIWAAK